MDAHDRLIQALTDRSVYEHPTTEITVLQKERHGKKNHERG